MNYNNVSKDFVFDLPVTDDIFFVHCVCDIELKGEYTNGDTSSTARLLLQDDSSDENSGAITTTGNVLTTVVGSSLNVGLPESDNRNGSGKDDKVDVVIILIGVIAVLVLVIIVAGVVTFVHKRKSSVSVEEEHAVVSIMSHKKTASSMEMPTIVPFTVKYDDRINHMGN